MLAKENQEIPSQIIVLIYSSYQIFSHISFQTKFFFLSKWTTQKKIYMKNPLEFRKMADTSHKQGYSKHSQ